MYIYNNIYIYIYCQHYPTCFGAYGAIFKERFIVRSKLLLHNNKCHNFVTQHTQIFQDIHNPP